MIEVSEINLVTIIFFRLLYPIVSLLRPPSSVYDIEESDDAEEQLRFSLQFHRNDRLDGEHADKFCSDILNIVLDHEGMYDGWGTTIVKP